MATGRLQLVRIQSLNNSKIICRCLCTKPNEAEAYYKRRASKLVDKILRVDHAGEYGADKIYAGQIAVLGRKGSVGELIQVIAKNRDCFMPLIQENLGFLLFFLSSRICIGSGSQTLF